MSTVATHDFICGASGAARTQTARKEKHRVLRAAKRQSRASLALSLPCPRSFKSPDAAQAAVGPAPAPPLAENRLGPVKVPPPARPPGQLQTSSQHPGEGPLGPEPAPSKQLLLQGPLVPAHWLLSCPYGTGTAVLPSADHPMAPPRLSLPLTPRAQHHTDGWWGLWWLRDQGLVTGRRGSHQVAPGRVGNTAWTQHRGREQLTDRNSPGFGTAQENKEGKVGGTATRTST